jgi:hypothetical protein
MNHEGHEVSRRPHYMSFPSCDFVSFVVEKVCFEFQEIAQ